MSAGYQQVGTKDFFSVLSLILNRDDWCTNYQPDAPTVSSITYDAAGTLGITVASDKSIVGDGSKGVIKGKGLRVVSGATNVILQVCMESP